MLHFVLRRTINRSTENGKSFGWEWFIVRLRTFYRLPQWKEAERWASYLSSHNTLYESHLPYILKDERSFWENSGEERMKKEDTSIRLLPFKCILLILPTGLTSVSPIRLAYAQYREQPYLQTTFRTLPSGNFTMQTVPRRRASKRSPVSENIWQSFPICSACTAWMPDASSNSAWAFSASFSICLIIL